MKKVLLILFYAVFLLADTDISLTATDHAAMKLLIGYIGSVESMDQLDVAILVTDLGFTKQFDPVVRVFNKKPSKQAIKALSKEGFYLAIFINPQRKNRIDWCLYDVIQQKELHAVSYHKKGALPRGWSHQIADAIWPLLTGQPGFFSTRIAYCKETETIRGASIRELCIADYNGMHEEIMVNGKTVLIGSRWNADLQNPLLFYSEYTDTNVRMMIVDMHKRRKIASNFDGTNMLPTFAPNGSSVIYCASKGDGYCQLYWYHDNVMVNITQNSGNNISPIFSADGNKVYFCSDFKTKTPQIFEYDMITKVFVQLTEGGYCTSPTYCARTNQLAYTRMVKGIMQVFIYDIVTKKHTQITFNSGNKEDCAWSACGNYLLYSIGENNSQHIALFNIINKEQQILTAIKGKCSCPSWSPVYYEYPVVV